MDAEKYEGTVPGIKTGLQDLQNLRARSKSDTTYISAYAQNIQLISVLTACLTTDMQMTEDKDLKMSTTVNHIKTAFAIGFYAAKNASKTI
jgi:hypothetical protein